MKKTTLLPLVVIHLFPWQLGVCIYRLLSEIMHTLLDTVTCGDCNTGTSGRHGGYIIKHRIDMSTE